MTAGNSAVILGLWPAHAFWTNYSIARLLFSDELKSLLIASQLLIMFNIHQKQTAGTNFEDRSLHQWDLCSCSLAVGGDSWECNWGSGLWVLLASHGYL